MPHFIPNTELTVRGVLDEIYLKLKQLETIAMIIFNHGLKEHKRNVCKLFILNFNQNPKILKII